MNGHVLDFAMHAHDEAQRLLPWLANGTLDANQREWLQRHLEGCAECRQGLRESRVLRTAILESTQAPGDVDSGWKRMRLRIAMPRGDAAAEGTAQGSRRRRVPRWLGWAVAAQALQLLAFAGTLWWVHPRPATYRTLGNAAAPAGNLLVVFDPTISEAQLRRLLDSIGARIVDGPTDAGSYVLSVPASRTDSVRDALRAAPGVTLVERLGAGPP
jgi:hypothetical protein